MCFFAPMPITLYSLFLLCIVVNRKKNNLMRDGELNGFFSNLIYKATSTKSRIL